MRCSSWSERARSLALAAALVLAASGARACPGCTPAEGTSRWGYLSATLLLSFLPLAIAGAIALWIALARRRGEPASRRHAEA